MGKLLLASLLVLAQAGCGSNAGAAPTTTNPQDVPICQSADGGVCSGVPGAQGPQGLKGDTGSQGVAGPAGLAGATGAAGAAGAQGSQGPQGQTGATGPAGAQGATGAQGLQGAQGIQGVQGPKGADGLNGKSAYVGGKYVGTTMTIGVLVPLIAGGSGIYIYSQPGQATSYPGDMIVTAQGAAGLNFAGTACSGAAYYSPASAFSTYNNQVIWVPTSSLLYTLAQTQTSYSFNSYRDATGCHTLGSALTGSGYAATYSGFQLDVPSTQPWTVTVQ